VIRAGELFLCERGFPRAGVDTALDFKRSHLVVVERQESFYLLVRQSSTRLIN
jgi:hypothetical protein